MNIQCDVIPYGGWANCVRLTNGRTELVATTDVGPRIIRYGKPGGPNFLKEYPRQMGRRGGLRWRIFGGHRLWIAPEDVKRTYVPMHAVLRIDEVLKPGPARITEASPDGRVAPFPVPVARPEKG